VSAKRVVVDTNVVVSGLIAGGAPQKILQAWIMGQFQPVISSELKDEINTVLRRNKLVHLDGKKKALLGTLFNQAIHVLPRPISEKIFPDPDDHFLIELAVTAHALFIVSGDKGILNIKKFKKIEFLSPQQFCQKLNLK
tara:strand:+ start:813 stop:1229 length:417 start_codon:yes stop_codon:yes gene_type:complete